MFSVLPYMGWGQAPNLIGIKCQHYEKALLDSRWRNKRGIARYSIFRDRELWIKNDFSDERLREIYKNSAKDRLRGVQAVLFQSNDYNSSMVPSLLIFSPHNRGCKLRMRRVILWKSDNTSRGTANDPHRRVQQNWGTTTPGHPRTAGISTFELGTYN